MDDGKDDAVLALLKLSHDEIIFENYDDELVLFDMPRGIYYTIDRVGADCLLVLLSAPVLAEAWTVLERRFDASPDAIRTGVTDLVERLAQEMVVAPRADGEAGLLLEIAEGASMVFAPPRVEQYKDIEDILKFDPVHEVNDAGWPHVQAPPVPPVP